MMARPILALGTHRKFPFDVRRHLEAFACLDKFQDLVAVRRSSTGKGKAHTR